MPDFESPIQRRVRFEEACPTHREEIKDREGEYGYVIKEDDHKGTLVRFDDTEERDGDAFWFINSKWLTPCGPTPTDDPITPNNLNPGCYYLAPPSGFPLYMFFTGETAKLEPIVTTTTLDNREPDVIRDYLDGRWIAYPVPCSETPFKNQCE